jgi:translation initiation factor 6 (eIF-6)
MLPPGVDVNLKLIRASDSFVLMQPKGGNKTYKVVISELQLQVQYISVADAIIASHMAKIQTQPILMPIKKTMVLTQHVGAGAKRVNINNQFQNRLPKTLIIGMLGTI